MRNLFFLCFNFFNHQYIKENWNFNNNFPKFHIHMLLKFIIRKSDCNTRILHVHTYILALYKLNKFADFNSSNQLCVFLLIYGNCRCFPHTQNSKMPKEQTLCVFTETSWYFKVSSLHRDLNLTRSKRRLKPIPINTYKIFSPIHPISAYLSWLHCFIVNITFN